MTNEEMNLIVKEYQAFVFSICRQFVKDTYDAQNLAQETFLSAYKHMESLKHDNLKAWLARIATNKAKDFLKSAYVKKTEFFTKDDEVCNLKEDTSPEDIYIKTEGENKIVSKIYELKEPYRMVSILYFIEEKKICEIAKQLKRPEKTVQTQVCRAKIMLQKILRGGG